VSQASYKIPPEPTDPRVVMTPITKPDEIESIQRAGFYDIIGAQVGGLWYGTKQSVEHYRNRHLADPQT
jgi:hypothetical protein